MLQWLHVYLLHVKLVCICLYGLLFHLYLGLQVLNLPSRIDEIVLEFGDPKVSAGLVATVGVQFVPQLQHELSVLVKLLVLTFDVRLQHAEAPLCITIARGLHNELLETWVELAYVY